jgi:hypothetical protein
MGKELSFQRESVFKLREEIEKLRVERALQGIVDDDDYDENNINKKDINKIKDPTLRKERTLMDELKNSTDLVREKFKYNSYSFNSYYFFKLAIQN